MEINFLVKFHDSISIDKIQVFDAEIDDALAFLTYACEYLDEADACVFEVHGFGQDNWPVDVYTDLPIFLSQIPNAIASIQNNNSFIIDFYEQGTERTLEFIPTIEAWKVKCKSDTSWLPNPKTIIIDSSTLNKCLCDILENFLETIDSFLNPESTWTKTIEDWVHLDWTP